MKSLEKNKFRHSINSLKKSGIYQIQAFAEMGEKNLKSIKKPMAVNLVPPEANNAVCQPEHLALLTTEPTGDTTYENYKQNIDNLLKNVRNKPVWTVHKLEKNSFIEILLIISIFALLSFEWFLERKVLKQ